MTDRMHRWEHANGDPYSGGEWASHPDQVTARCIGVASDDLVPGVVLASFNAG